MGRFNTIDLNKFSELPEVSKWIESINRSLSALENAEPNGPAFEAAIKKLRDTLFNCYNRSEYRTVRVDSLWFCEVIHDIALALAKKYPLKTDDPIDHEEIPLEKRLYIGTGEAFHIENLYDFHIYNGEIIHPVTLKPFSTLDDEHIRQQYRQRRYQRIKGEREVDVEIAIRRVRSLLPIDNFQREIKHLDWLLVGALNEQRNEQNEEIFKTALPKRPVIQVLLQTFGLRPSIVDKFRHVCSDENILSLLDRNAQREELLAFTYLIRGNSTLKEELRFLILEKLIPASHLKAIDTKHYMFLVKNARALFACIEVFRINPTYLLDPNLPIDKLEALINPKAFEPPSPEALKDILCQYHWADIPLDIMLMLTPDQIHYAMEHTEAIRSLMEKGRYETIGRFNNLFYKTDMGRDGLTEKDMNACKNNCIFFLAFMNRSEAFRDAVIENKERIDAMNHDWFYDSSCFSKRIHKYAYTLGSFLLLPDEELKRVMSVSTPEKSAEYVLKLTSPTKTQKFTRLCSTTIPLDTSMRQAREQLSLAFPHFWPPKSETADNRPKTQKVSPA